MTTFEHVRELAASEADALHGGYTFAARRLRRARLALVPEAWKHADREEYREAVAQGCGLALARINRNRGELGLPELAAL